MARPIEAHGRGAPATPATRSQTLSGLRVLILEDDYYIAMDAKTALETAGAEVIGPLSSFEQLQGMLIGQRPPDCAVVDINLGEGPSFAAARRLRADGIPFLFLTGYGPEAVAAEFQHIAQTLKPARAEDLVQAVRQLCL